MTEVLRDHQRGRVYAWEERFVAPCDLSSIAFAQAQGMVDAIWTDMGLRFPPKVMRLPRQARATVADATRLVIRLSDTTSSWCLLHELAHAMSRTQKVGRMVTVPGSWACTPSCSSAIYACPQVPLAGRCTRQISRSTCLRDRSS